MCCGLWAVCCVVLCCVVLCVVCCVLCAVCCVLCAVCCVLCAVCSPLSPPFSLTPSPPRSTQPKDSPTSLKRPTSRQVRKVKQSKAKQSNIRVEWTPTPITPHHTTPRHTILFILTFSNPHTTTITTTNNNYNQHHQPQQLPSPPFPSLPFFYFIVWCVRHLPQNRELFMTGGGNGGFNLYKYHYPASRVKEGPPPGKNLRMSCCCCYCCCLKPKLLPYLFHYIYLIPFNPN